MDLDCLGSLIIVKKLYPDYRLVRSRIIHPTAQYLYELYSDHFDFMDAKDLAGQSVENIIIVDTCIAKRVSEYFAYISGGNPNIRIFDHHRLEDCDIQGAKVEGGRIGAITSYLAGLARGRGVLLSPEDATIALTAIYADTGRFIYENVRREDYEAAAWLIDIGASLKIVKSSLETITEDSQHDVLNRLILAEEKLDIQGHFILATYLEIDENIPGLAAVVEKLMDLRNPDAYFAVFAIRKSNTIFLIARSQKPKIDLHEFMEAYGGGGHQAAASAKITGVDGPSFREELFARLERSLEPAVRAADIMNREVNTVSESMSLLETSLILEKAENTGAPVLDGGGKIAGFISLRDIMKGRKTGNMRHPVKAFMTRPAISAQGSASMREIEKIFFRHNIGQLPIVENGRLLGIIARRDFMEYIKAEASR